MSVRLEEIHPALVHFPLALLPAVIGADLLARVTGSERLADLGRTLMPIAAASAAVSAAAGLIAQEEVEGSEEATALLVTHRNLNLSLVTLATAMATRRLQTDRPGVGYLALGLLGLGAMSYSAYLGGKMVYDHGLGVREPHEEITRSNAGRMARRAGRDLESGVRHALDDLTSGDPLPAIAR